MINSIKRQVLVLLSKIKYYNLIEGNNVIIRNSKLELNCKFFDNVRIKDSIIKKGSKIYKNCSINNSVLHGNNKISICCNITNTEIGKLSYVNDYGVINNTTIGKYCSIGPNFKVGYGIHPVEFISTSPVFYLVNNGMDFSYAQKEVYQQYKKTLIGNDVWIGANVFINEGIIIGHGAIIGAGAVITKDVPPYSVVGGVPGKVIKYRFKPDVIEFFLKLEWWNKDDDWLFKNNTFFNTKITSIKDLQF